LENVFLIEKIWQSDYPLKSMNGADLIDEDMNPTRSSLVERLKDWEDQKGWREFFDLYWKLLYCVALKAGLSDAEARDVVQESVVAVAKNLRDGRFEWRRGSFRSWLLTILHRKISNHFRARKQAPVSDNGDSNSGTAFLDRIPAPSSEQVQEIWDEEWTKNLADAAIERVKRRIKAKLFQTFDLYVLKEWPVQEVARVMGIHAAQVYIAKYRVTAMIRREVQQLEAQAVTVFESQ
jgi:RNA polymerase sigma factor (sigma-70 family)